MSNANHHLVLWIAFSLLASSILGNLSTAITQEESVAILFAGQDKEDNESFAVTEEQILKEYRQRKYRTYIIGGVRQVGRSFSAASLRQVLEGLRSPKILYIDFLGHGGLWNIEKDRNVIPEIRMSASRRAINNTQDLIPLSFEDDLIWHISNQKSETTERIYHYEIVQALNQFHQSNPKTKIEIRIRSCYGGVMVHLLRHRENVLVFASSPANTLGYHAAESQFRSHIWDGDVSHILDDIYLRPEHGDQVGHSPLFENVMGWCEDETDLHSEPASETRRFASFNQMLFEHKMRVSSFFESSNRWGKYVQLDEIQRNYQLDEECLERWKVSASAKELDNFDRIAKLLNQREYVAPFDGAKNKVTSKF